MLALACIAVGTLLNEASSSIAKWGIGARKESLYTMGVFDTFWMAVVFVIWALYTNSLTLALDSLPYFFARAVCELAVFAWGLHATATAERGTMSLVTVLTIPLVLVVDLIIGYDVPTHAYWGIGLIILAFIVLFARHAFSKKGLGYALAWTLGVVATISLFKYNITYYNSVQGEQAWVSVMLLLYAVLMATFHDKQRPFRKLFRYPFAVQALARGVAIPLLNFSYSLGVASVIVAAKRAFSITWALLSGSHYFHERHISTKIIGGVLVLAGIIFLIW